MATITTIPASASATTVRRVKDTIGHLGTLIVDPLEALNFLWPLPWVYATTQWLVIALGDDIREEFATTQVSLGSARKFAWLTPLTKTKALLVLDLWEDRADPLLRSVIPYRHDKFTHPG